MGKLGKYRLLVALLFSMPGSVYTVNRECHDKRRECATSAQEGSCRRQPELMYRMCPKSCKVCELMERSKEFGVKQDIKGWDSYHLANIVKESQKYIDTDKVLNLEPEIFLNCWNRHSECSRWADLGECVTNELWMRLNCGPACQACHLITMDQIELE